MNINIYLDNDIKNNKIENDQKDTIINYILEKNYFSVSEFDYLKVFFKNNSIININYILKLINNTNDSDLIKNFKKVNNFVKISDDKIIKKSVILNNLKEKNIIKLTEEQIKCCKKIIKFLFDENENMYGFYGYAGTGKTTTFVELMFYLINSGYISKVVFTAPTNKAVNVIKSKFKPYIKILYEKKFNEKLDKNFDIESIIDKLYSIDIKIEFITIHKLLKFKTDYSLEGELIFTRNIANKSLIYEYDVIVIDECSMISINIIEDIIDIIEKSKSKNVFSKIIFSGDPAQLPPVNEYNSIIFVKNQEEYNLEKYISKTNSLINSVSDYKDTLNDKRLNIIDKIIKMKKFTLKNIVRSKLDNVKDLSLKIRKWINSNKIPNLFDINNKNGVYFYQFNEKINSNWFKKFIYYQKKNVCSIILTWTNEQSNIYNKTIRNILFNKNEIKKFMKDDLLMLTDYYSLDLSDNPLDNTFYTSDQVIVHETEVTNYKLSNFSFNTNKSIQSLKFYIKIETLTLEFVSNLNKFINEFNFKCWNLCVKKIGNDDKFNLIRVVHEEYIEKFKIFKNNVSNSIIEFSNNIIRKYSDCDKSLKKFIIKPLWKQWHSILINPFANVNYGYSISCHKSQGSNFYNVFVDMDDILKNNRENEYKKCIYTAITRTINEVHILI